MCGNCIGGGVCAPRGLHGGQEKLYRSRRWHECQCKERINHASRLPTSAPARAGVRAQGRVRARACGRGSVNPRPTRAPKVMSLVVVQEIGGACILRLVSRTWTYHSEREKPWEPALGLREWESGGHIKVVKNHIFQLFRKVLRSKVTNYQPRISSPRRPSETS